MLRGVSKVATAHGIGSSRGGIALTLRPQQRRAAVPPHLEPIQSKYGGVGARAVSVVAHGPGDVASAGKVVEAATSSAVSFDGKGKIKSKSKRARARARARMTGVCMWADLTYIGVPTRIAPSNAAVDRANAFVEDQELNRALQ